MAIIERHSSGTSPLERAVDLAPTGLLVVDPTGRIRWANRQIAQMLDRTVESLSGQSLDDLVHPAEGSLVPLDAVAPGRTVDRSRRRMRRADGSLSWVRMVFTRLPGPDGWIVHVADISEIVRAEERLGLLVEGLDDGVVVLDPEGRIASVNPAASRMLGVGARPMVGRPLSEWAMIDEDGAAVEPGDRPEAIAMVTGSAAHAVLGIVHAERPRWVRVTAQPLQRTDTERWIVASYKDVTDRRRALEAIEADRAKSEFLSRMSHELRTPLNSVLGFAQLLLSDDMAPRQREAVEQIVTAGRHLLGLVDEVLDLARIEADRLDLLVEPVSLDRALREAVELVQPLADASHVSVDVVASADLARFVSADRQRLRQVLLNLLSNAIKYNHRHGTVTIHVESTETHATVHVDDTGRGIAAEHFDHLFTPFERLGAEHLGVEGVGVGLALSKRLVEAMRGTIDVESRLDHGSRFSVTLTTTAPASEPDPGTVDALVVARSRRGPSARRRILYVEDNEANRRLMERVAARNDSVELVTAQRAVEGLALARASRPDAVLLDLHLPDRSGEDVLRELRADPNTAGIPVIVVSADATPSRIDQLLAAGAAGYLAKPVDMVELFAVLDGALIRG
jgi:PAS domain S-box-containing protein